MNIQSTLTISGKTVYVGKAFGKDIALCIAGIGKVNAALGTQVLVSKFGVDKLLNFGVAGGLNSSTTLCQVYQIEAAVQFDFDLTELNGTKMGTLDEYTENYLNTNLFKTDFEKRKLGTADRFNDSKADYQLLTEELQKIRKSCSYKSYHSGTSRRNNRFSQLSVFKHLSCCRA